MMPVFPNPLYKTGRESGSLACPISPDQFFPLCSVERKVSIIPWGNNFLEPPVQTELQKAPPPDIPHEKALI